MNLADEHTSLIEEARAARRAAYAPYSQFEVGAAVLCGDGRVFRGANIENSSYGLTLCAERVAVAAALADGARAFEALAVVTDGGHAPCGACRQFLAEWGGDLTIFCVDARGAAEPRCFKLDQLLPEAFRLSDE